MIFQNQILWDVKKNNRKRKEDNVSTVELYLPREKLITEKFSRVVMNV